MRADAALKEAAKHMSLLDSMKQGIVLADGAMGTQLQQEGLPAGDIPASWNVSNPKAVRRVTDAYIEAGAKLVRTNTFGANQPVLQVHGLADKEDEINEKGAEIALACAEGKDVLVAGSVGPTGLHFSPAGYENYDAAVQIFSVQLRALKKSGISILSFESFTDITEMRACIMAAKHIGGFEILSCMSYDERGNTATGTPADACAVVCESLGADVIGASCCSGPQSALHAVESMEKVVNSELCAFPSAGMPDKSSGKYPVDAARFASDIVKFADKGVRLVGGCCGTGPEYIKAASAQLAECRFNNTDREVSGAYIASPLGIVDLARDDLTFTQMDLHAVKSQLEVGDFQSVSYALPADWDFCDACVLDFHKLEDDFDVQKLVTAITLYLKKPVIVSGGTSQLIELFLQYYPGRAAVMHRAHMPDMLFGALVVGRGYKPLAD